MPIYLIIRVCVRLYSFTVKASSDCKMSETYLRGTDQRTCVVNISQGASVKFFISISENVIFHLQRRKLQPAQTEEKAI